MYIERMQHVHFPAHAHLCTCTHNRAEQVRRSGAAAVAAVCDAVATMVRRSDEAIAAPNTPVMSRCSARNEPIHGYMD